LILSSSSSLTVLAYHRITNPDSADLLGLRQTVSATPDAFAEQMDYMAQKYNVISVETLHGWLHNRSTLPPRAAMITFDDGYRDNWEAATPILLERGLSAVFFLATDHIDSCRPFFWDKVAYYFDNTKVSDPVLPLVGRVEWTNARERNIVQKNWLLAAKNLVEEEKLRVIDELSAALDVEIPPRAFADVTLTWEQVRAMKSVGMTIGAHTRTHPILTKISTKQAETQIRDSKSKIESEIGFQVETFAYPNGHVTDYNENIQQQLSRLGFLSAFTLLPGPSSRIEVRQGPLTIRRILISHNDGFPRFVLKVKAGLPRWKERFRKIA